MFLVCPSDLESESVEKEAEVQSVPTVAAPVPTVATPTAKLKKNKKARNALLNSLKNKAKQLPVVTSEEKANSTSKENVSQEDSGSSVRTEFFVDDSADKLKVDNYVMEKFFASIDENEIAKENSESDEEYVSLNETTSSAEYASAVSESPTFSSPSKETPPKKKKGYHKTSSRTLLTDKNIGFVTKTPKKDVATSTAKSKGKLSEDVFRYTPDIRNSNFKYRSADFPPLS